MKEEKARDLVDAITLDPATKKLSRKWIAINSSIYTEDTIVTKLSDKCTKRLRMSIAFNVGSKVAEHLVKIHNQHLDSVTQELAVAVQNRSSKGSDWTGGIGPSRHHSADMDWPVEACPPTGLANFEVTRVSRSDIVTLRHAERDVAIAAMDPRIASSMLLSVASDPSACAA